MKLFKKILAAALASSLAASGLPTVLASETQTAPEASRRLEWRSENLTDSAIPLYMEDYKNGQWSENIMGDGNPESTQVNPADFIDQAKGSDVYEERINVAEKVYGKFGKASDDTAVRMHTKNAKTSSPNSTYTKEVYAPSYEFGNTQATDTYGIKGQSYQWGGYQKYSFDLALTEAIVSAVFRAQNPDSSTWKNIFYTTKYGYQLMDNTLVSYSEPIQSDKWYHIDIILRSGIESDDTQHHIWLYIDGKLINDMDFTWTKSDGTATTIKRLKSHRLMLQSANGQANSSVFLEREAFFDNVSFEYWAGSAPAIAPLPEEVDLTTGHNALEASEINGVYVNIDPEITVSEYKQSLKNKDLTVVVRDKSANEIADTESLAGSGNYIELTAPDGTKYYRYAYASRTVYENEFDTETVSINGEPSGGSWGITGLGAQSYAPISISNGVKGKQASDKVYKAAIENYTGASSSSSHHFSLAPKNYVSTAEGDKVIVEYSIANEAFSDNVNRLTRLKVVDNSSTAYEVNIKTYGNSTNIDYHAVDGTRAARVYDNDLTKWHKHTVVFTQGSTQVDFYLDGVLKYSQSDFLPAAFASFVDLRFWLALNSGQETPITTNTYYDDISITVAPDYTPEAEVLTSPVYTIDEEDGTIAVGDGVIREEFDANVSAGGYYTVYDDNTMTSTDMASMIVSEGMVIVAKNGDDIVKEYAVIAQPEPDEVYGDVTFTDDGTGKVTAVRNIANNGTGTLSGTMIICAYSDEDTFSALASKPFSIASGKAQDVSVELENASGSIIKVFVWSNLTGIKPLCISVKK